MHIEELRDYCLRKKGAYEELPFGPDTLVFKVGGRIFLLLGLDQPQGHLSFTVKCTPSYALSLREEYEQTVFAGYHMNKKHWNTVYANRQLDDAYLNALIDHSYELVVQCLPGKEREKLSSPL